MAKSRKLLKSAMGLLLSAALFMQADIGAEADGRKAYLDSLNGGISAILDPNATNTAEIISATAQELNLNLGEDKEEESTLVMANVTSVLNVREEPSTEAAKAGKLYKDCGGTILERKDGWTKIQSGNLIGWAKDEFLLFGDEAEEMASDVGITVARINADVLNVRKEPSTEAGIYGQLPKDYQTEVLSVAEDGWACIDYDGADGYVSAEYLKIEFKIDEGETLEEIKEREAAEAEAKRHKNYGAYTTDADTTMLLAALIQCEAGGEAYEGQLAVGAVVMNRVRSGAYPDSIHAVIYASGQFTPAQSGKVNRVLEGGKIKDSCIKAAQEAISGVSNVGDMTHFRRNNGRDGLVIGNHVFY